jgi:hypothetical protein
MADDSKDFWRSSVFAGLIVAGIGLLGNVFATFQQTASAERVAHAKAQSDLILEAIRTGDPKKAATNLLFLARLGLLDDPENAPYLPIVGPQRAKNSNPPDEPTGPPDKP